MTTVPQTSGARDYRWKHKSLSKAQEKSWGATEKFRGNYIWENLGSKKYIQERCMLRKDLRRP